ncbi:hypothetical protein ACWN8M_08280 [Pseudolactococcus reticulitermitis]
MGRKTAFYIVIKKVGYRVSLVQDLSPNIHKSQGWLISQIVLSTLYFGVYAEECHFQKIGI